MQPLIDAVVLAAGRSTRMGAPKARLPLGEDTFLGRILKHLSTLPLRSVRIVAHGEVMASGVQVVQNPWADSDQIVSLQCGLRDLPQDSDAVLVWPVDHPLVAAQTVESMLTSFASERPAIVQPLHQRPGHPVLFAQRLYAELLQVPEGQGARFVVRRHLGERLLVAVQDPHIHTNIDTPEAYRRWTELETDGGLGYARGSKAPESDDNVSQDVAGDGNP